MDENKVLEKKEISAENFVFLAGIILFFVFFSLKMGMVNTLNTFMNTAYSLLMDTVFYLMAICVMMGAISALCLEFGVVALANKILDPLMKPLYGLPGVSSVGIVMAFLSDNPAILVLAEDNYFKSLFKKYQYASLVNLGTSFGMGMIVCTFMLSLSAFSSEGFGLAVGIGFLGAVAGSVVSTRMMMFYTKKVFGKDAKMELPEGVKPWHKDMRPIREGSVTNRFLGAILDGGMNGVNMGLSIIPGVLIICTIVMMLTNGPSDSGAYTGAAFEGVRLLPMLADKAGFIIKPLFGFSSPECIGVTITSMGAAGAASSMTAKLVQNGLAGANDVAVFTAMCTCWSGYLSTHVSMMNSIGCKDLTGKALISHTVGGFFAGVAAHWLYMLVQLIH